MAAPCLVSHLGENKSNDNFSTSPSNGHSSPLLKTESEETSALGLKETTVVFGSTGPAGACSSTILRFFSADEDEISVAKLFRERKKFSF